MRKFNSIAKFLGPLGSVRKSVAAAPTYSVTLNTSSTITESGRITFTLGWTNVTAGTRLYWTADGTVDAIDLVNTANGALSGNFLISGQSKQLSIDPIRDGVAEGQEYLIVNLRTGGYTGPIVASTGTIYISDTSTTPYGTVYHTNNGLDETGAYIYHTFYIETHGIPIGTTIYWTNEGTTTAADFVEGINSGSTTVATGIISNGLTNNITLTVKADALTEGSETIDIRARTGSITGPVFAIGPTVNGGAIVYVTDTSLTPLPTLIAGSGVNYTNYGYPNGAGYISYTFASRVVAEQVISSFKTGDSYWDWNSGTQVGEFTLTADTTSTFEWGYGVWSVTFYYTPVGVVSSSDYTANAHTSYIQKKPAVADAATTFIIDSMFGVSLDTNSPSYGMVAFSINSSQSPPATIPTTFTIDTGFINNWGGETGRYTVTIQTAITGSNHGPTTSYQGTTASMPTRTGNSSGTASITYSAPVTNTATGGQFDSPGPLGQGMMSPGDFWFADNTVAQQIVTAFKTGVHFYVWGEPWNQTVGEYVVGPSDAFLHHPGSNNVYISFNYVGPPAVAQNFMTHANGYYIETVASGGGGGGGSSGGTVANLSASGDDGRYLYIQFISSTDATAFVNWGGSGTIIITAGNGSKMSYTGVSAIPFSPPAPPGYVRVTYSGTPSSAGIGSPGAVATVTY